MVFIQPAFGPGAEVGACRIVVSLGLEKSFVNTHCSGIAPAIPIRILAGKAC